MPFKLLLRCSLLLVLCFACRDSDNSTIYTLEIVANVHQQENDQWLLTYKVSRPVSALFIGDGEDYRFGNWEILSEGKRLIFADTLGLPAITADQPFDSVAIRFKPYTSVLPNTYTPFRKFTDGSWMIFTGQFTLLPRIKLEDTGKSGSREEDWSLSTRVFFHAFPGNKILLSGQKFVGSAEWIADSRGTYVYIGTITPIETEYVMGVIDPGAPFWMVKQLDEMLPRLFAYYAEKTNYQLHYKPLVLLSFKPRTNGGSMDGGALPGIIQLSVEENPYGKPNREQISRLAWFIAHEAAHLWNSQLFHHQSSGSAWLHEGGAESFAYSALRHLNLISEKDYLNAFNEALVHTLTRLPGYSLNSAATRGAYQDDYAAGLVIGLITEKALQKARTNMDIIDFWRVLFRRSFDMDNIYSQELYLETLLALTNDEISVDWIRTLANTGTADLTSYFEQIFKHLQIPYRKNGKQLWIISL